MSHCEYTSYIIIKPWHEEIQMKQVQSKIHTVKYGTHKLNWSKSNHYARIFYKLNNLYLFCISSAADVNYVLLTSVLLIQTNKGHTFRLLAEQQMKLFIKYVSDGRVRNTRASVAGIADRLSHSIIQRSRPSPWKNCIGQIKINIHLHYRVEFWLFY